MASGLTKVSVENVKVKFIEDGITFECPLQHIKNASCLEVGDRRLVKWSNGKYYEARIREISSVENVKVKFIEDGITFECPLQHIKNASCLEVGDIRLVKWSNGKYYEARILEINCKTNPDNVNSAVCHQLLPLSTEEPTHRLRSKPPTRNEDRTDCKTNPDNVNSAVCHQLLPLSTEEPTHRLRSKPPTRNEDRTDDEEERESLFSGDSRDDYIPPSSGGSSSSEELEVNSHSTEVFTASASQSPPEQLGEQELSKVCTDLKDNKKSPTKNKKSTRTWDKKYSCFYCKKLVCKLPRHLFLKHKNETLVKDISILPKGDALRQQRLLEIRNKGNFTHNVTILTSESKDGILITKKTNPKVLGEVNKKNYLPCDKCLGFFAKRYLYRHSKKCGNVVQKPKSNRNIQSRCALLLPGSIEIDKSLTENVMSKMVNDEVYQVIRNDQLILHYGQNLYNKHGHEKHLHQYVSQKMRGLGRFVICAKEIDPNISNLTDCLHKNNYPTCVAAVKKLGKFIEGKSSFKTPSIALKTGHALKQCANILRGQFIFKDNEEGIKLVDRFLSYFELSWTKDVSSHALRTINENHWNKPKLLPLAEDVKKFNNYLKRRIRDLKTEMIENPNENTWHEMAKYVLAHVVTFNRKRVGETQRLTIETYGKKCTASMGSDVKSCLSELEIQLAESLVRVETRGKKGRGIAILLTGEMTNSIDLLLQFRNIAKIDPENPFVFPNREGECLRGSDCLRLVSAMAKLTKPKLMTSTGLRKHVGTMSQILNLSNHELDILANFMGHDIRVHRNFYRLSEDTLQMAKVSKVLVAMERGQLSLFKGKSLDEIEINVNEEAEEDDEDNIDDMLDKDEHQESVPSTISEIDKSCTATSMEQGSSCDNQMRRGTISKRKPCEKQPWTAEEKNAVFSFFEHEIDLKIVPKKDRCVSCILEHSVLKHRTWKQIKFCVYNKIKSKD